ncbi:MAG: ribonuclease HII [Candidatus Marinimicrobia bacterium]|nr:ribonuclease HII [Candidatus Neomarinimicrobiota bacterium]MDP6593174.1 ribonuclease HII [Candidatus Neomarinimicrobiota bacterium]MDP6836021.1 ribonuclease HII [Candidatus Neomarinimicrobiota bacterium]
MIGSKLIAGVDEAGRGPLAGPVVAAAVILPNGLTIDGVRDSKKVAEKKRERLHNEIMDKSVAVGIGIIHEDEIDRENILDSTRRAMRIALGQLSPAPHEALIDGYALPDQVVKNRGIIDGDEKVHIISAASIIAKVTRDRMMRNYDIIFPEYGFAQHKGYGTRQHLQQLREYLACSVHRKSFRPVKDHMPRLSDLKKNRRLGQWGERLAAQHLVRKGYDIIEMNFNAAPHGEIDIVARNREMIVFVEVKTASQEKLGRPEDQVDETKIEKLANAMEVFISENDNIEESRFDMMTVRFGKGRPSVRHYEDCLN